MNYSALLDNLKLMGQWCDAATHRAVLDELRETRSVLHCAAGSGMHEDTGLLDSAREVKDRVVDLEGKLDAEVTLHQSARSALTQYTMDTAAAIQRIERMLGKAVIGHPAGLTLAQEQAWRLHAGLGQVEQALKEARRSAAAGRELNDNQATTIGNFQVRVQELEAKLALACQPVPAERLAELEHERVALRGVVVGLTHAKNSLSKDPQERDAYKNNHKRQCAHLNKLLDQKDATIREQAADAEQYKRERDELATRLDRATSLSNDRAACNTELLARNNELRASLEQANAVSVKADGVLADAGFEVPGWLKGIERFYADKGLSSALLVDRCKEVAGRVCSDPVVAIGGTPPPVRVGWTTYWHDKFYLQQQVGGDGRLWLDKDGTRLHAIYNRAGKLVWRRSLDFEVPLVLP